MVGQILNPLMPMEYLVLIALVALGVGGYMAWRAAARCSNQKRLGLTVLRVLALLALAVMASNPGRWVRDDLGVRKEVAVLVDRSASMKTADVVGKSRWTVAQEAGQMLTKTQPAELPVSLYSFGKELSPVKLEELNKQAPDAGVTDILGAGSSVLDRYRSSGRRLAAMVYLTDGRQTGVAARQDLGMAARAMDCPIYPVPIGGIVAERDLAITADRRQYVAFPKQKVVINFELRSRGFESAAPNIQLLDSIGQIVVERKVSSVKDGVVQGSFETSIEKPGYHRYMLNCVPWEGERNLANNRAEFAVLVPSRRMRVFVAEGVPSWDSKFFLQHLRRQKFFQVTSVHRVTNGRYFQVATDTNNVSNRAESNFPNSKEELALYDLIIIGKGAEYFLDASRLAYLRTFVRDQGGSLMFFRGKPYSGDFPELESLEPVRWGQSAAATYSLQPTEKGEEAGLFGDVLPGVGDSVWTSLPKLKSIRYQGVPKPFSSVFMEAVANLGGKDKRSPVLVTRRFGKGVVINMNAEGLWQWDFFPVSDKAAHIYATLWTQLLQWSAVYAEFLPGQRYALRLSDYTVDPGEPIRATVIKRHRNGGAVSLTLKLFRGTTELRKEKLAFADGTPVAGIILNAPQPGTYRLELYDADGKKSMGPCRTLHVQAMPTEDSNLSVDSRMLVGLAESSGGRVLKVEELPDFLKELQSRSKPAAITDTAKASWVPFWDSGWLLCLVCLFFGVEWFVRKRSGLL